jgi:hypothetical protein
VLRIPGSARLRLAWLRATRQYVHVNGGFVPHDAPDVREVVLPTTGHMRVRL